MKRSLKSTLLGITAGLTALAFSNCSTNLYRTNSVDPLYHTPKKTESVQYITQEEYNSLDKIVDSEKDYVVDTSKNNKNKDQKDNYVVEESQTQTAQTYPTQQDYMFYDFDNDGIIDWNDPWPHRYGPYKDMNNNHIVDFHDWQISGFTNPWLFDYEFHSQSWYDFYGEDYMSSAWFWREPMIGWEFGWSSWHGPRYSTWSLRNNWTSPWRYSRGWNSWSSWNYGYYPYSYNYNNFYWNSDLENLLEYREEQRKPGRTIDNRERDNSIHSTRIRKSSEDYDNDKRINTNRPNYIRIRKDYRDDAEKRQRNIRTIHDNRKYERPKRESILERNTQRKIDAERIRKIRRSNSEYNVPERQTQRKFNNSHSTRKRNTSTNIGSGSTRTRKSNSSGSSSGSSRKSSGNSGRKRK